MVEEACFAWPLGRGRATSCASLPAQFFATCMPKYFFTQESGISARRMEKLGKK
jgi:hypothetical protein